ncbi:ion channel CASTOR-like isoform X3 [Populus alba]|uniref:ion channel CASTOR-like isoform X3 n=1 Tax=Populus alba TaxID=43335 RepID=UPI003CC70C66
MSLDSQDSTSPSFNRDWFFPSPSFIHQSPPKPPKPHRRFSTASKHSPDSNISNPPSFRSSPSLSPTTSKYGRLRRRVEFPRPPDKSSIQHQNASVLDRKPVVSSEKKQSTVKVSSGSLGHRVRVRWNLAITVAIVITALTSLVHKNFTLHNQVIVLQDQILKLNVRLRACNLLSNVDTFDSVMQELDDIGYGSHNGLKNLALIVSVTLLSIPVLAFKYIDFVSKSRSSDSVLEEALLNKQLAYRVDIFLSVHPYAKPLALLVATLLVICLGGLALFGVTDDNLADCLWLSWTFVADSGNHANTEGIGPRLVSVSISFGGMLIFAMMLGLVSDSISEKFDSLRKGRSEVVEQNHTLILGWSDKLGSLLNQLGIANESLGGGIVVVMAERDKEEMEMDIAKMEFDFKGTSVICRSGSPLILADLKKVSVSKARAIVVLAEDGNADQSDARALRTVLSLTGVKEGLKGHIVVELSDLDNEVLVKLVGGDLVKTVVAHDVIGRLMIQCARQPGLAQVWRGSLPKDFIGPKSAEKILFCGWRRDMEDMIMVLDAFLAPGSELWMFNDVPENEREKKLIDGGLDLSRLENIQLVNREGNAVIRRHLESLPLQSFDSILILADESVEDSAIQADSRSLATLLLIRDIQSKRLPMVNQVRRGTFSQGSWIGEMQQASDKSVIISEILDPRTKNLLSMSKISDYVLSNELVSMALAMVAEDQQINDVLEELFADEGNELQIRQADLYLSEGEELSFYEVLLRARQRREIVIGYRAANAEKAVINPPAKSERRRWSLKDVFVVIAEKE